MIYKEIDPFADTTDKRRKAGYKAEQQMAHLLYRFFKDSSEVDVLNSLRIDLNGDIAQIDHLILMPHGLLIVESKSVSEKIQIKEDGQWIRWYDNKPQGMRSPITQANMQGMLLKELLSRAVKQKGAFDNIPVDVLVAVSEKGVIEYPSSGALPEVCKDDQVPARIKAKLTQYGHKPLGVENRRKIADFLKVSHRPVVASETIPTTISESAPAVIKPAVAETTKAIINVPTCKYCQSHAGEIKYGKFGYYLLCEKCQQNTSLKPDCTRCGKSARLRKEGKQFFVECADCGTSQLFFTNPR